MEAAKGKQGGTKREFLFSNVFYFEKPYAVAWNRLTYDLVQCDSFSK
jgi:hypothetical protein